MILIHYIIMVFDLKFIFGSIVNEKKKYLSNVNCMSVIIT